MSFIFLIFFFLFLYLTMVWWRFKQLRLWETWMGLLCGESKENVKRRKYPLVPNKPRLFDIFSKLERREKTIQLTDPFTRNSPSTAIADTRNISVSSFISCPQAHTVNVCTRSVKFNQRPPVLFERKRNFCIFQHLYTVRVLHKEKTK